MSKKIIGVTGGLATGKTTVADMFAAKGALKVDADDIAHELLEEDVDIRRKVIDLFGDDILSGGRIDRRKLAEKVFSDRKKLDDLCGVLHPGIIRRIKEEVERSENPVIVIDAPLLIEAGLHDYVDIVVVVTAQGATQIERARGRGISKEEARRIIDSQMPLLEKTEYADHIIENDTDMETMKEGVEKIWQKM